MKNKFFVLVIVASLLLLAGMGTSAVRAAPLQDATTYVIYPDDLKGWNFFVESGSGSNHFMPGPGTPPLGTGSVQFRITGAGDGYTMYTTAWANTLMSSLTTLTYSTYHDPSSLESADKQPAFVINVDYNLSDADHSWQGRLVYDPYLNGTPVKGTWQNWNPLTGYWWATDAPGNALCPQSTPCLLSTLTGSYPNIGVADGIGFKVGSGWANGFIGNVDNFIIGDSGKTYTYDFEPLVPLALTDLDLLASDDDGATWTDVPGSFAGGFTLQLDPAIEWYYLDTANLVVNRSLKDGLYPFYIDTYPAGFFTYWDGRGVNSSAAAGTWQAVMWEIINGDEPMFYLKVAGTSYDLIDGLQYLASSGTVENPLRINGDYLLGVYTFTGTVEDQYGYTDDVEVGITFVEPLSLTDLDLLQSINQIDWTEVPGSFSGGFTMELDPAIEWYYLDTANLVVNRPLADGLYPFYVGTTPAGFFTYWDGRGVNSSAAAGTWQAVMWEIINGDEPMFYLKVAGTSYDLIDGLQYLASSGTVENPLRINGTYLLGSYTFTGDVEDQYGYTDDVTVQVAFNDRPVLGPIGNQNQAEAAELTFTVTAADVFPGTGLAYSLVGAPTGAAINPTSGAFAWTPTEAQGPGTYPFDVCVSDGTLNDCETITVTVAEVNVAPVLGAIGNKSVDEEAQLAFTVAATDADLPANTLTYNLVGAPTGAAIDPATGAFTWTPGEAQGPGTYPFDVCVRDGILNDCETITVTVAEVNVAPVMAAIGNKSVDEGSQLAFTATATDADLPANAFTFSLVGAPTGAAINPTSGAFTWTPSEAQGVGIYPFDVCVSDGTLNDCETITVTVTEVNVAPVMAAIDDKPVDEGSQLAFTAAATDADLPVNTLTYSLVGAPTGAAIDPTSGAFTWTPGEAQGPGTYPFDVCVSDGALNDCTTTTVTVAEVNVAPVMAAINDKSVDEGSQLAFTAAATDADLPANTLTYSLVGAPTGAAIDPTSGAFTWTPTEDQGPGTYPFDVCVSDGALNDCTTTTVTVAEVNVAPVLGAIGNKSVDEETQLVFTAVATDADLPANLFTFSLVGAPTGAAIDPASGAFTWTPSEDQGPAEYAFKVMVCDNGAPQSCDEEEITVTVNGDYTIYLPMLFKNPATGQKSPLIAPVIGYFKR